MQSSPLDMLGGQVAALSNYSRLGQAKLDGGPKCCGHWAGPPNDRWRQRCRAEGMQSGLPDVLGSQAAGHPAQLQASEDRGVCVGMSTAAARPALQAAGEGRRVGGRHMIWPTRCTGWPPHPQWPQKMSRSGSPPIPKRHPLPAQPKPSPRAAPSAAGHPPIKRYCQIMGS